MVTISGWGVHLLTEEHSNSLNLLQTDLHVILNRNGYHEVDRLLQLGRKNGRSACFGDSGGKDFIILLAFRNVVILECYNLNCIQNVKRLQ